MFLVWRMRMAETKMAAYLVCLTAGGGVPLFYRNHGNLKPLPFPVIGSLNGVHMFAASHGAELVSTTTDTAKVVWKLFHNSITLILVCEDDNADDAHATRLLDYIFQAMVLLYGLDDLTNIKNVERFKREIKVCYKMVDCLLKQGDSSTVGHHLQAVDVLLAPENELLQTFLEGLLEAAGSPYGCLCVRGRLAVASARWWALTASELVLLNTLLHALPPSSSRDVPVFLPNSSPKVPHRLLTFQLTPGVEICTLCGPTPSLAELEREVVRFWSASLESLRSIGRLSPRNMPPGQMLDPNMLGFFLVNRDTNRSLSSVYSANDSRRKQAFLETTPSFMPLSMWSMPLIVNPGHLAATPTSSRSLPDLSPQTGSSPRGQMSEVERRSILLSFYRSVVGKLWPLPPAPTSEENSVNDEDRPVSGLTHTAEDTYICADTYKCYALQRAQHQLFALYHPDIPTYAMRSATLNVLDALVQERPL